MSYISKVEFVLHPTFHNPNRVVEKPPFEIVEHGWGEFDLNIKIHFSDISEPPLELVHNLRFYQFGEVELIPSPKPVVFEQYDEIVFFEPTEQMYQILTKPTLTPAIAPSLLKKATSKGTKGGKAQTQLVAFLQNKAYVLSCQEDIEKYGVNFEQLKQQDLKEIIAATKHMDEEVLKLQQRLERAPKEQDSSKHAA